MKIWKLQKPLFSSGFSGLPEVMAYTEGHENMAMIPMAQEFIDEIFGDELKIYVKATVKNGVLKVKHQVEEQDW